LAGLRTGAFFAVFGWATDCFFIDTSRMGNSKRRPLSNMKLRKKRSDKPDFDLQSFLAAAGQGRTLGVHPKNHQVFLQGDPADAIFYIQTGKIKLTVVSKQGKEAVVGILGAGEFFGEGCLAGQPLRMASAASMSECSIMRLEKAAVTRLLHDQPAFSELLLRHLLARNIRIEEDLVDQLFNSSEKRLARVLLLLANFGKEGKPEPVIPKISQETLAEIVGTTRSRVSFFMNRFRKMGFIQYDGQITGGLEVHSSLLNVILHD
jgi:CRP/FNR family transcriptional regulator, cyclic AMP receptor protein